MLTWFRLWPLLIFPLVTLVILISLPMMEVRDHWWGGAIVREWLLNNVLLVVLPAVTGWSLVGWFTTASPVMEWLLALLIIININAVALPFLYGLGEGLILFSAWFTRTELAMKRKSLK